MKNNWIIDKKTCTSRFELAGKGLCGTRWEYLRNQVNNGGHVAGELLTDWFKIRSIPANIRPETISKEAHAVIKAAFCMLQVGCVVLNKEGHVALFQRPKLEAPTGVRKLTSGYSILRSWSPASTAPEAVREEFLVKTGLELEDGIRIEDYGLGYNELTNPEQPDDVGPGYFFVVKKANWRGAKFTDEEYGASDLKSGEKLLGFYDPEDLIKGTLYNDKELIEFEGRMDRLVLESLVTGRPRVRCGNLAAFSTASRIMGSDVGFSEDSNFNFSAKATPFFAKLVELLRDQLLSAVVEFIRLKILQ